MLALHSIQSVLAACSRRFSALVSACLLALVVSFGVSTPANAADTVFVYSSAAQIRGVNLTQNTERLLTISPNTNSVNGLAVNTQQGLIYYGAGSRVYYWDPALGSTAAAHSLLHDFETGSPSAPIQNIQSTAGSFLDGKYYVGSETGPGFIEDLYEVQMSSDGKSVVSITPLDIQGACNCSGVQLGGFGDVAARYEGGSVVIYGSTADLTNNGSGTSAGRWRFEPATNSFTLLAAGAGGQMAASLTGDLFTSVGNSIRTLDPNTGQSGNNNLYTTNVAIWDFSSGYNMDFGDAPDSYGSAFHLMPPAAPPIYYLGQIRPDNESYSINDTGSNATGDDSTTDSDEDAVTALQSVLVGPTDYTLSVQCTAGAYVVAWIDANVNGVFDANERNSNHPLSCNSNSSTLVWSSIDFPQAGNSMVRIRTSTDLSAVSSPVGLAIDGEVEDHALSVTEPVVGSCPAGSESTIYSATGLTLPIGPNANQVTRSVINVPESTVITDINLRNVIGTHTYINDLIFTLDFNGQRESLYGPACNGSNNFSIGFDDEATGNPPCPPVDGESYPPVGSFANYDGLDAQGDWTLEIRDRFNQDGGQLQSWELEVCSLAIVYNPDIRLAKTATVNGSNVEFTLRAVNTGDIALTDVVLQDNLDTVFGVGNYSIVQAPQLITAPAGFAINGNYNGSASVDLLSASGILGIQEELVINISVLVDNVAASDGQYTNQASSFARDTEGTNVSDLSGDGNDVSTDTDTPTPFQMSTDITLSGFVFIDSSVNIATSHDGIFQTNETPIANRTVNVLDAGGNTVGTAVTDGSGNWTMQVTANVVGNPITVSVAPQTDTVFISESPNHISGSVTDGELNITSVASNGFNDLNIGVITTPILVTDQTISTSAGSTALFAHRYTAPTSGMLSFTLTESKGWNASLYNDTDCDGQLGAGESLITAPLPVVNGQQLCLIIDTFVPSTATGGEQQQIDVLAELAVSDNVGTGHSAIASLTNTDVLTVTAAGSGRLVLEKNVINVTKNGPLSVDNAAAPGDTLEYLISYSNEGTGPLTQLVINDETPAYTTLIPGSLDCGVVVSGVQCTPSANNTGLSWTFTGSFPAGASGQVSYQITVD